MFELQATVITKLALHQSQRDQSIPTLSVLMGQAISARSLWAQSLYTKQRQTIVSVYQADAALFDAWFAGVCDQVNLYSLVISKIAAVAGQPAAQVAAWLTSTSEYQRELFWQRIYSASDQVDLLRWLLDSLSPTNPAGQHVGGFPVKVSKQDHSTTTVQCFATVTQVLPETSVPGLLVLLPANMDDKTLYEVLVSLTQLVEAVPALPVGLSVTAAQTQRALDALPESRMKAMLRNGVIEIPTPNPTALRQWLQGQGVRDEAHLQQFLHLVENHGATAAMLKHALAVISPTSQSANVEPDKLYRSHAEWLLFQYLEARAMTVGRFQVNSQLGIDFGGRPMEVDFLDVEAKIVVELDGHYHFTDLDNYRRDRRKDRLLQQHGFLVLRFFSEDVISHLETIFDAIDQALVSRQTQPSTIRSYPESVSAQ